MKLKRFKGDTVLYFVCAVLLIALGVVLLPQVTDLGQTILNYVVAAAILIYLFAFLIGKIKRSGRTVKILTIVEFVLMLLVALGLVLSQFKVLNVDGVARIIGFALALRGIVEMFRAYFHNAGGSRYPILAFCVNLAILIFGVYMFASPLITDATIILILAIASFACAIVCIAMGSMTLKKKKK